MQFHTVGKGEAVALVFGVISLTLYGIKPAVGIGRNRVDCGFFVGAVAHLNQFFTLFVCQIRPFFHEVFP